LCARDNAAVVLYMPASQAPLPGYLRSNYSALITSSGLLPQREGHFNVFG
jgi:hypothetical protein